MWHYGQLHGSLVQREKPINLEKWGYIGNSRTYKKVLKNLVFFCEIKKAHIIMLICATFNIILGIL